MAGLLGKGLSPGLGRLAGMDRAAVNLKSLEMSLLPEGTVVSEMQEEDLMQLVKLLLCGVFCRGQGRGCLDKARKRGCDRSKMTEHAGQAPSGCSLFSYSSRVSNLVKLKAARLKLKKFTFPIQHLINLWELVP